MSKIYGKGRRQYTSTELKGEHTVPLLNNEGKIIGETSLDQIRLWLNRENKK